MRSGGGSPQRRDAAFSDLETRLSQPGPQPVTKERVVLDEQHSHDSSIVLLVDRGVAAINAFRDAGAHW